MTDWRTYEAEADIIDLLPDSVTITDQQGKEKDYPLKSDGEIIVGHLPVRVPLRYCKVREYNSAQETLSALGIPWKIGELEIKPPVLGVFTLMELTNNPFPVNFMETTTIQKFHVLFFNEYRERAALLVRDWNCNDQYQEFDPENQETWTALDVATMNYIDTIIEQGVDVADPMLWSDLLEYFTASWNGFEMVPGKGSSKFWFCAETLGGMISGLASDLNCSYRDVAWNIPISTIGFSMVGKAKQNGVTGVQRPHDRADMRRQRILAYLRELHGELHPWQIDDPERSVLTDEQAKHKTAVEHLERLQKEAKNA